MLSKRDTLSCLECSLCQFWNGLYSPGQWPVYFVGELERCVPNYILYYDFFRINVELVLYITTLGGLGQLHRVWLRCV